MTPRPTADVGVFGGSGFYEFLDDVQHAVIDTPYGPPSAPVAIGGIDGVAVAFLARHGVKHELPPHKVNWRANAWAMREVGVRWLVGPCAVGSLRPDRHPGEMVVLDQLVDRTWGRGDTFFDGPVPVHVPFADPYCPELGAPLIAAAADAGVVAHEGGTVVVIQGPRFSTRAESRWFRSQGWDVVNMTQYPEAFLARELGICYAGLALVTDYDTGVEGVVAPEARHVAMESVTMDAVFAVLEANVERTRQVLRRAIPRIAALPRQCACATLSPTVPES
ncbi:MAG TPA: S-methyl-5'-thioadenosine phosphorylase [Acidimicrobiales bacterium]|nr:S-methyl-5'-thioadenosine phosphorylase [Acidimicrobiales bacterium]